MDGQGASRWKCGLCGQQHDGLARAFGAQALDPWLQATPAEREAGELNADMCVGQLSRSQLLCTPENLERSRSSISTHRSITPLSESREWG